MIDSYFPERGRPRVKLDDKSSKVVKISPRIWNYYNENKNTSESIGHFLSRKLGLLKKNKNT